MERIGDILKRGNYPKSTEAPDNSSQTDKADEETIREYEEKKAKYGYAANPFCSVCGGVGFLHPTREDGKPNYGRVVSCEANGCIADQARAYRSTTAFFKARGLDKAHTFEQFKPVLGGEETLAAFRDIAFNESAPPMLLIYGTTGNGKTHLCEATGVELLKRGIECRFWAVADLISELKQSFSDNTTESLMATMKKVPALILDDWGQNYGSVWEVQKLEEIILARERANLITIITTNQEPDQPEVMPERVVSRFRDRSQAKIILNAAEDYRPKKGKTK